MPILGWWTFETGSLEHYPRREITVEWCLFETHLAGVSVRRFEDINEALWGYKVEGIQGDESGKRAVRRFMDFACCILL